MTYENLLGHPEFGEALRRVTEKALDHMKPLDQKYFEAHKIRIFKDHNLYTDDQINLVNDYLEEVFFKQKLASIALEQIWALVEDWKNRQLQDCTPRFSDENEMFSILFCVEQYLLFARSVIDFFAHYICCLFRIPYKPTRKFGKFMNSLSKSNDFRAKEIHKYFDRLKKEDTNRGIDEDNWMAVLIQLRNKVRHIKRIKPHFAKGTKEKFGDWPSIQGVSYCDFCQTIDSGIFYMFRDLFPVFFGVSWKSGL